jgi:hypothetical protein
VSSRSRSSSRRISRRFERGESEGGSTVRIADLAEPSSEEDRSGPSRCRAETTLWRSLP